MAEYISLVAASHLIPGRPSLSSIHRWAVKGIRGHRLKVIRVGAKFYTTKSDVEAFLSAQQADIQLTHVEADAELAAEGL